MGDTENGSPSQKLQPSTSSDCPLYSFSLTVRAGCLDMGIQAYAIRNEQLPRCSKSNMTHCTARESGACNDLPLCETEESREKQSDKQKTMVKYSFYLNFICLGLTPANRSWDNWRIASGGMDQICKTCFRSKSVQAEIFIKGSRRVCQCSLTITSGCIGFVNGQLVVDKICQHCHITSVTP